MVEQIETLLDYLAMYGGKIVCTASLDVDDINQARASKRMYVDQVAIGYVWIPNLIKFPENDEEVAFFEKWYPLEIEIPDKNAMFNRIINGCKATKGGRQKFYNSKSNNVSKNASMQKLNLPHVINNEVTKCSCGEESSTPLCFECFKKSLKMNKRVSVCCPYKHDCNELKHYKKCNERCSMYKQTDL